MAFEDVYLVSDKKLLVAEAHIRELKQWLNVPLPKGYETYMTTLGIGRFCDLVNVMSPQDIIKDCPGFREMVREHWFWDSDTLTQEEATLSVRFGTTDDGDDLVFFPGKPTRLFALPRHSEEVFWTDEGFVDPLAWAPLRYRRPPPFRYFESFVERLTIELFTKCSFDLQRLTSELLHRWDSAKSLPRLIRGENYSLVFIRRIGARLQLTNSPGDPRVGITIRYDADAAHLVNNFVGELTARGFYETGRHPH